MISRPFWVRRIEQAWSEAPIVWLSGVRRAGKTCIATALGADRCHFVNCDLPVTGDMLRDPELFYRNCSKPLIVFDEIHQLRDPSRVLKIGADVFPHLKILATGSSTLAASKKFSDTLTGRKRRVHLLPVLWDEIPAFGPATLTKRLYHGGLPPVLLAPEKSPSFYREWMDSFFARDVQKLFGFRDESRFTALFEYLLKQSGGLAEISRIASEVAISRPTVMSHFHALEVMHAVTLIRPFFGGGQKEVVKMPKCYGFDTGFVSFCRGWDPIRPSEYGILWEHLVLEWLVAHTPDRNIQYWRDMAGREIDFVISYGRDRVDTIECKWNPADGEGKALKTFRTAYPRGRNFLIAPINQDPYVREMAGQTVHVCNPGGWRGLAMNAVVDGSGHP